MHSFIFLASLSLPLPPFCLFFTRSQDLVPRSSHSLAWPPFWINFHSPWTNQSRDFCCVPGSSLLPPPYWKARRPWERGCTKRPRRSKPDSHSHLLVWTYRVRRVDLNATRAFIWLSQRQHHLTDLNSNSKKIIIISSGSQRFVGFSGGAQTRYKKYPCKGSCKRKSYETICENIVSRYQTVVSSLPREAVFRRRRPKAHFMTGRTGSPVIKYKPIISLYHFINCSLSLFLSLSRGMDRHFCNISLLCQCFSHFWVVMHKNSSVKTF